jgi:hypothetical protein
MGEMVGKPEGVWKNNIEMDLKQIGWESVKWIHLTHGGDTLAFVNVIMNLHFSSLSQDIFCFSQVVYILLKSCAYSPVI